MKILKAHHFYHWSSPTFSKQLGPTATPLKLLIKGRGCASQATKFTVALLLCLLVCLEKVDAATYTVGGSNGWTFNMATWPQGKRFRAGDVLVFSYDASIHNVVAVNRGVYNSGKDHVKLGKGLNFFICNTAGHCESGMKIAINAV